MFVAAGGYHHHLGLNTWHSRGASPPPDDMTGLRDVTIQLPHPAGLMAVQERLQAAGWPLDTMDNDNALRLHDPSGNALRLTAAPIVSASV